MGNQIVQINGKQYYLKPVKPESKQQKKEDKLLIATMLASPASAGIYHVTKNNPDKVKESATVGLMINPLFGIAHYFFGKEKTVEK